VQLYHHLGVIAEHAVMIARAQMGRFLGLCHGLIETISLRQEHVSGAEDVVFVHQDVEVTILPEDGTAIDGGG
jgi:hypothetical protein